MKIITIETEQFKPRTNSKHWTNAGTTLFEGLKTLVDTPKYRTLQTLIIEVPDDISLDDVKKRWDLVQYVTCPILFNGAKRHGISYAELLKDTESKATGKSDYASVMVGPIKEEYLSQFAEI